LAFAAKKYLKAVLNFIFQGHIIIVIISILYKNKVIIFFCVKAAISMKHAFEQIKQQLKINNISMSYQRLKVFEYLVQNHWHPTVENNETRYNIK